MSGPTYKTAERDAHDGVPGRELPPSLAGVRRIVFLGDSLTDGSDYPDYVVNTLNARSPRVGFEAINAGICGNNAADLLRRLQRDVLDHQPDLVSICIGTNDNSQNRPLTTYRADLEELVKRISAQGARVMLILPSPFGDPEMEREFQGFLSAIRSVATAGRCILADAHSEFVRALSAGRRVLGPDGIHHGPDGFEAMGRAVLDALGCTGVTMDRRIRPWPGTLIAWEQSDPVDASAEPDPSRASGWRAYEPDRFVGRLAWHDAPYVHRGAFMPFDGRDGGGRTFIFGRASHLSRGGEAQLQVGGSYPLFVWLNGQLVFRALGVAHGYHPNADRVRVECRPGQNEVVVATTWMTFAGVVSL